MVPAKPRVTFGSSSAGAWCEPQAVANHGAVAGGQELLEENRQVTCLSIKKWGSRLLMRNRLFSAARAAEPVSLTLPGSCAHGQRGPPTEKTPFVSYRIGFTWKWRAAELALRRTGKPSLASIFSGGSGVLSPAEPKRGTSVPLSKKGTRCV